MTSDWFFLSDEPPYCPAHPGVVMAAVPGEPLMMICMYGCEGRLDIPDAEVRAAYIASWPAGPPFGKAADAPACDAY